MGRSSLVRGVSACTAKVCPLPMGPLHTQAAPSSPDSLYASLAKEMGAGEGRARALYS